MAEARLNSDVEECSAAKKSKTENENAVQNDASIHVDELCLSTFEITRVLQNNCTRKQIFVEGTFKGRENPAIVLLEKKNFPAEEQVLKKGFFAENTTIRKLYTNDVYGNYEYFPVTEHNGLNATIIHPATSKHIEKFKRKEMHIVDETYELYQKVTLPHIEANSFSLEWIHNILEHKSEMENIVFEDSDKECGFILITDLKWDGEPGTLKLLALPFQKIRCIRELNASHLPLLRNIRDAGTRAIAEKFNIPASQLRLYFHYQPSYYYLHVHFAYLMFEPPAIYVEKAHLLSVVIRNIELIPDYYQKAVLPFAIPEGEPLFKKFEEEGILCASKSKST